MFRKDEGFTLVELMVVVLIIGILVAIAVPVFLNASASAQAKSCQANQRTIVGAIQTFNSSLTGTQVPIDAAAMSTAAKLGGGTNTTLDQLIGSSIKSAPVCPKTQVKYTVDSTLQVISDTAAGTGWSVLSHQLGSQS
jgi:type IV pilus assembly protein PilA